MEEGKAKTNKLKIFTFKNHRSGKTSSGRGVKAACDIEAGEIIISIPKKLIITYEVAAKSKIGQEDREEFVVD